MNVPTAKNLVWSKTSRRFREKLEKPFGGGCPLPRPSET